MSFPLGNTPEFCISVARQKDVCGVILGSSVFARGMTLKSVRREMNQKRLIGFILGGGRSAVKGGEVDWQALEGCTLHGWVSSLWI